VTDFKTLPSLLLFCDDWDPFNTVLDQKFSIKCINMLKKNVISCYRQFKESEQREEYEIVYG